MQSHPVQSHPTLPPLHPRCLPILRRLANPSHAEESQDSQMVARLLHRLLQTFEQHTGEDFEGEQARRGSWVERAGSAVQQGAARCLLRSRRAAPWGMGAAAGVPTCGPALTTSPPRFLRFV